MRKNIKIVLTLSPLLTFFSFPLIAASCANKNKESNSEKISLIKNKISDLTMIVQYEEDENEKNNAQNLLNEINNIKKDESDIQKLNDLITKIENSISSFNNRNTEEKSGLVVKKIVKNQGNVKASEVVNELKNANSWEKAKEIFKKYSISVEENDLAENEKLSIASSTHAHDKSGQIHLDIKFQLLNKTERFELNGFKKVELSEIILDWKFGTSLIKKLNNNEKSNLLSLLKNEQEKEFNSLLKKLKEYIEISKINSNDHDTNFKIEFENKQKTIIEKNKMKLLMSFYSNNDHKNIILEKQLIIELENNTQEHD
ncbi:variable surface lipoprotein [Metamycoplasma canadense]|uniref:Lipoprotein n=1 Tax=Metamycoplasma canadense TaxID=29554 RepID=A0A077L5N7_9BACT|nr:variable surface lipoprotein [Metamycoplasma canadense]BAP39595.1 hypothetical protein MCAN360_0457 [Metamycoplasma canadense]